MVEILENVRGKDVFVLQSTCMPTNDTLMEVMVMVDALKRASAGRITAAIPYFGYARQDRRPRSARVAITAKVVANMLQSAGVDRLLTMDLHSDQIQGFFDIPVDNVYAAPILLGDVWKHDYKNLIVVSPDVGGVVRARALAKRLESDLAIIDKRRPKPNVAKVMNIIGDVSGRTCVLMDDLVDTANTLCEAAAALERTWRGAGGGLLYPSGTVRQRGGAGHEFPPGRTGGDRHHSAARRSQGLRPHPPAFGGRTDGRDDAQNQQRGLGKFLVHGIAVRRVSINR